MIFFLALGNVLLGKGMRQMGEVQSGSAAAVGDLFLKTFMNGWIWVGIACLLLFLVSFMVVLSWADFSFVMPATALSYLGVALLSRWLLGEVVTGWRWAGVACICLGVALVTRTPSSTTEPK